MASERGSLIQLSPDHDQVSTQDHDANGVWDYIMKVDIPEGVEWVMENGQFLVAKLYNGSGTEISGKTSLAVAFETPGDSQPRIISPEMSYRPFSNLSPTNQRDSDYRTDDLKIFFDSDEVSFTEEMDLYIMAKGPDNVDLSDSGGAYDSYCDFNVREYEI